MSEEREYRYCILKKVIYNGQTLPVAVLDTHDEVLEFETIEAADAMAAIMEKNSDSGWDYVVKVI